jgi:hypothetical protein
VVCAVLHPTLREIAKNIDAPSSTGSFVQSIGAALTDAAEDGDDSDGAVDSKLVSTTTDFTDEGDGTGPKKESGCSIQ